MHPSNMFSFLRVKMIEKVQFQSFGFPTTSMVYLCFLQPNRFRQSFRRNLSNPCVATLSTWRAAHVVQPSMSAEAALDMLPLSYRSAFPRPSLVYRSFKS